MSRRTQQQLKNNFLVTGKADGDFIFSRKQDPNSFTVETVSVPSVNDPSAHVPAEVMEQAKKIREALHSGKAVCDGCMRIFSGKLGLKVHRGHGCKGRNG